MPTPRRSRPASIRRPRRRPSCARSTQCAARFLPVPPACRFPPSRSLRSPILRRSASGGGLKSAGDLANGNPKYAVNLTSVYTFSLRLAAWSASVGGTLAKAWTMTSYQLLRGRRGRHGKPRLHVCHAAAAARRRHPRLRAADWSLLVFDAAQHQQSVQPLRRRAAPECHDRASAARAVRGIGATFNAEPRLYVWSATFGF
jgi:hypothetical protein